MAWLRRMDVPDAQYAPVKKLDPQLHTVHDLKTCFLAQAKLEDVDSSLLTLHLVRCGSHKPTAEEEGAAVVLADPSLSLREAGVTDTAWLLAFVAKPSSVASAPPRVLAVTSRARGRQQLSEWRVSSQEDLDRHLAHGLLWLSDSGGKLIRSVVTLSELSEDPSATYHFLLTSEAGAVETATATLKNLAAGTERESTRGIASDELVHRAFGSVHVLLGGEPVEFYDGESKRTVLEADGLLGTTDRTWVLLNSAKLTAGKADVIDAIGSASMLQSLLRRPESSGQASLAPYAGARVHAFLSASHFLPGVAELAVQEGVTPVLCSGARFHVPPAAAASLPGGPGNSLSAR
jgi:hypothetical protein